MSWFLYAWHGLWSVSLRAEMRALKDELDRTTDALIHQGKTLRKTTENLLKMSNKKDAEIQQLQSELKVKDELLRECEKAIRHMHYCKYWLNKSHEDCDCNMHLIVEKLRERKK